MSNYKKPGRPRTKPEKKPKGDVVEPGEIFRDPPTPDEVAKLFSGVVPNAGFKKAQEAHQPGQPITKVVSGFTVGSQNTQTIKKRLSKFWRMPRAQLQALVQDAETPMGDIALAAILVKAASEGCPVKLSFILDRMVGKVKVAHEKIEEDELLQKIPTEKLVALLEDLPQTIDAKGVTVDVELQNGNVGEIK
jgi:hypothetical protein